MPFYQTFVVRTGDEFTTYVANKGGVIMRVKMRVQ